MADETVTILTKIVNLCESDPDAGLDLLEQLEKETPDIKSNPHMRFARASAYMNKGIQPIKGRPYVKIDVAGREELLRYLNDDNINYLELALSELGADFFADFVENATSDEEKTIGARGEAIAIVLERCRPGRVQQILGRTKLKYFGTDRIATMPYVKETLSTEGVRPFLDVFFTFPTVVRSTVIIKHGKDTQERQFIWCTLFEGLLEERGPDDTVDATRAGIAVSLIDDGTFIQGFAKEAEKKGFFKKLSS